MKKLFLLLLLTITSPLFAQNIISDLCQEVMNPREVKATRKFSNKLILKAIFRPSSLIEMEEIPSNSPAVFQKGKRIKFAFISIKKVIFTKDDKKKWGQLENKRKTSLESLKQTKLTEYILSSKNTNECISSLNSDLDIKDHLLELQNLSNPYLELLAKKVDSQTYRQLAQKKSFLKSNGWKIYEGLKTNAIHELILMRNPNDVLFIGHASQDGSLIDSDKNIFPKGYFEGLKNKIDNLIIYSCFTDEVARKYELHQKLPFNIYLSKPQEFSKVLIKKSVFFNSLRAIKKIKLRTMQKSKPCFVEVNFKISHHDFGLFLNGKFISALKEKVLIPCSEISETNTIEVFSNVKTLHKGPLINSIAINSDTYFLKEFVSSHSERHIVSRIQLTLKEIIK